MRVEAACAYCGKACSPMIVSGWGVCRKCRANEGRAWIAVNELPSASGRDWIKRVIRAHLAKTEAG